ncbi:MAG: bifunctional adenosylcobinamide kinase/adenosylcobinamide-phosphate guanylyltransferase [Desulfovibrionaceae bacterium]|nr:bifunctional adenosylcobinamide kinase/adenosylcobinamide-phosphate guanylyltransferase [Desulfovibrionaceae bacterium]
MLTLVLGGRRSGKSSWAENRALSYSGRDLVYLATCLPRDAAMRQRVLRHQERRAAHARPWTLREEPVALPEALKEIEQNHPGCTVLLDCLSLWLANLMEKSSNEEIEAETDRLLSVMQGFNGNLIVVSNEVGLGVAPANEVGNRFADLAGAINQKAALAADEVVFIAAGLPLYLK